MIIIKPENKIEWNNIVKSFNNWDIYYLQEYAMSLSQHENGNPILIFYKDDNCKLCYVMMKNEISQMKVFEDVAECVGYYDLSTPYGYGGPIIEGDFNLESQNKFKKELSEYCEENKIITQFIRFHPLLLNHKYFEGICEVKEIKQTISIDTSDLLLINKNMDSKNRNMLQKSKKIGVTIVFDNGEKIDKFKEIYESTMNENKASDYFYFNDTYYEYLINNMYNNTVYFYAYYDNKIISAAIFFYNDTSMHYHLSGTLKEYRHMASMNLLLNEASIWAYERGILNLHLGGGLDKNDNLFKFKRGFNKNSKLPFFIGRNIFNINIYKRLLDLRLQKENLFDINNGHLIQYRKE